MRRSQRVLEEYEARNGVVPVPADAEEIDRRTRASAKARVGGRPSKTSGKLPAVSAGDARDQVAATIGTSGILDVHAFLSEDEPEHDWLIEGLLECRERVVVTATEGAGKSTLLRQIAVQASAGIHPFEDRELELAVPVLLVDAENSARHVRRQLRPLVAKAGARLGKRMLWPVVRGSGFDLLQQEDREQIRRWCRNPSGETIDLGSGFFERAQPDPKLLIIGPLYKLATGDPKDEVAARAVAGFFDELREEYDLAIMIEAHVPYASTTGAKALRPKRPYGASLWSRWPEVGFHLSPEGEITHWRGQRDERDWPRKLRRGGQWPWTRDDPSFRDRVAEAIAEHIDSGGRTGPAAVRVAVRDVPLKASNALIDEIRSQVLAERGRLEGPQT